MKDLVNLGVNVVAFRKNSINMGMSLAWMMNVDYDRLVMVVGGQSDCSKVIAKGDIIGINPLGENNKDLALHFGEGHSLTIDKFVDIDYVYDEDAIFLKEAKTNLKCVVEEITRPYDNDEDLLVFVKVLKANENTNQKFLAMSELR